MHSIILTLVASVTATFVLTTEANAQAKKPNIVVIWGDGNDQNAEQRRGPSNHTETFPFHAKTRR
jgi:hypothetical protein